MLYLQHSQCVHAEPGGLYATTQRKEAKHNPDIVYPASDVKATYCRVQCLTLNLLPQPLKCVHISVSWHYLSSLTPSLACKPQQLILQLDRLCFHVGGSLWACSDDRKHKWGRGEKECWACRSTERPQPQPRQRCRGLEHTLAAEWFHLRISVITFRSVIYSWPSAAPHDPPLPQPFDQRKRQWLCKQALSVDSNGFTACFFSLVSLESCADTHRNQVSSYRTYFSPSTNLRARSRLGGT